MHGEIISRLRSGVTLFIRLSLALAAIVLYGQSRWVSLFVTILALFLTFLPQIAARNYKIVLPVEFEFVIVVFIYLTLFLGELGQFYVKFWWWDIFLHGIASVALGLAGYLIMFFLDSGKKIRADPFWIAVMTFSFALAIGALWEIFEFAMDYFLNRNMQKSGLVDTMMDLIVDSVGGLIASVIGYLHIRGSKPPLFDRAIERFVDSNPKLFK